MKYPTRRPTGHPLPAISGIRANRLKSEPVRPDVVEMANSHFATDGKNSTRAKLTELPRNDGGTQCRQFGGVYRPPCNLLDFKVNPNLDGFPIRGAKGAEICAPFGDCAKLRSPQNWGGPKRDIPRGLCENVLSRQCSRTAHR